MTTGQTPNWHSRARGGRLGNGFFMLLVRCGGLWLAPFFLTWVALYFVVAAPAARRSSCELARRLGPGRTLPGRLWFAFRHFYTFGLLMLDRVAILGAGQADKYDIEFDGEEHIREALERGRGVILLTAHLGNWQAMGHLLKRLDAPFCMVMFDAIDERTRATLEEMARDRSFRILYTDGSPAAAAGILAALRAGEMVGMMGDRVFAGESRRAAFLGGGIEVPVGAFVVGAAAKAPLIHVFAVRRGWRRYSFHGFPATDLAYSDRKRKGDDLQRWAEEFARRIETFVRADPYQWGNFFPIWVEPGSSGPD